MNSHTGDNISAGLFFPPVGHQFGFQADALCNRVSDADFYGAAGHFFWRKPDMGLLGVTGGYLYPERRGYVSGRRGRRILSRAVHLGRVCGLRLHQLREPRADSSTLTPTALSGAFPWIIMRWIDLRLGVAYLSAFADNLVKAQIEYQTPIRGLALTAEGGGGDNGDHFWLFGARYYFGGDKTLRDRQRQDDPPGLMPQILQRPRPLRRGIPPQSQRLYRS